MVYVVGIIVFGVLVGALGLLGFVYPDRLLSVVTGAWRTRAGLYAGAALRIVFGLILIAGASATRYPHFVGFVGWVAVVAGLSYPLIGYQRMLRFIGWWRGRSDSFIRVWSLVASAFGVWLIHAAL